MGLRPVSVLRLVVQPALSRLGPRYSTEAAVQLVFCTGAHESGGFRDIYQQPRGPAVGLFQMEPATFRWLRDDWLAQPGRTGLREAVASFSSSGVAPSELELAWNLQLAAAYCRIRYAADSRALPAAWDVVGQAGYWKRVYNTAGGKGRPDDYVRAWDSYCRSALLTVQAEGD